MRKIPQTAYRLRQEMAGRNRAEVEAVSNGCLWEIDMGHDLMITEPEAVAEMLLQSASL